jgi:hypothetical protein
MRRPLRIEVCGAVHHVTACGGRRQGIYERKSQTQTSVRYRALRRAYREGGLTRTKLSQDSGLLVTHMSRWFARQEKAVGDGV